MAKSTEISLEFDIVIHGRKVWKFFNTEEVSKERFEAVCERLLRRSRGQTSLIDFANQPPDSVPEAHLTVTVLRMMAASQLKDEIHAKEAKLDETREKIRELRTQLVGLLNTVLDTASNLIQVKPVQKWIKRSQPRSESRPPLRAIEA